MNVGSRHAGRRCSSRTVAVAALGVAVFAGTARGQDPASIPSASGPEPAPLPAVLGPAASTAQPTTAPAPTWIAEPSYNTLPQATEDLPPLPKPRRTPPRQHVFLIPGYLFSATPAVASRSETHAGRTSTTDVATGHGMELSLSLWPAKGFVSYGLFTQAQRYLSFNGNHNRYAFGLQASWTLFGLEAGMGYRQADDLHRGTTMLHLGVIMSLAFFHMGGRFGIPLTPGNQQHPGHGAEASLVLAVKIPIPLL